MDYQVVLSLSARKDLRAIVHYISLDDPGRARDYGQFLLSKTKLLGRFPEMGRAVPEFSRPDLREIIVRSYRVIYRVDALIHRVEVIRFWHGARGTPDIPPPSAI